MYFFIINKIYKLKLIGLLLLLHLILYKSHKILANELRNAVNIVIFIKINILCSFLPYHLPCHINFSQKKSLVLINNK